MGDQIKISLSFKVLRVGLAAQKYTVLYLPQQARHVLGSRDMIVMMPGLQCVLASRHNGHSSIVRCLEILRRSLSKSPLTKTRA